MREKKKENQNLVFFKAQVEPPKDTFCTRGFFFVLFFSLAYSSDTLGATHCFESSLPCLLKTTIMFETRLLRVSPKKS